MTAVFKTVLSLGWQAGLLALAVTLVRLLLSRRIPKWSMCLLWLLVGLRLVFPFSFRSTVSFMTETVSGTAALQNWPQSYVGETHIYHENTPEYWEAIASGISPILTGDADYVVTGQVPTQAPATVETQVLPILTGIWLAGVGLMLFSFSFSYLRLKRKIRRSRWEDGVYYSGNIRTPFVLGILDPRIYLPEGLDGAYIPLILAHERAHIARRDYLGKTLAFLLLSVYWFNPILWLSYVLLNRDIEGACDERALRAMTVPERAAYSRALVACAAEEAWVSACPAAFGENGVAARVKSILRYRKPTTRMVLLALAAALFLCAGFFTKSSEIPVFGLRPFRFEEVSRLEKQQLDNVQVSPVWYDADGNLQVGQVQTLTQEEADALIDQLSTLRFRGDLRNLAPWEIYSYSTQGLTDSVNVLLVFDPGDRYCSITLYSSGLAVVTTDGSSGFTFYRMTDSQALEPMAEYIKALCESA